MLNVLFISHCGPLNGANRSLLALIDGLCDYGVRANVVCPPGENTAAFADALSERRVPFHNAPIPMNSRHLELGSRRNRIKRIVTPAFALQYRSDRAAKAAAEEIVRRFDRPDCVYTNSSVTDVGYFVSNMFERAHVWHLREYGRPDFSLYRCGTARSARKRLAAGSVVAISPSVARHHRVSAARVHVVPNGVVGKHDLKTYRSNRIARESIDHFSGRFAALGVIHPTKGQHVAIAAFAKALDEIRTHAPNATLDIIGPGPTTDLRELAERVGIADRIRFRGRVDDPLSVMSTTDVHLTCSRMEGFGRVTAEAMACGAIAIGNNSGGTREVIDHDGNGLLYDGTVDGLASMLSAIASSGKLRGRLRLAAWEKVASEFTIERYAGRIFPILQEACRHPKEPHFCRT